MDVDGEDARAFVEALGAPLPREFYARDAVRLARALLGKVLVRRAPDGVVAGRIVEVEAYRGPQDLAAHTARGRRTPRNEVMWGECGRLYVYFVYGMHWCANVVAAAPEKPEAVLLRAVEPLAGAATMRARRARKVADARLASGPANLCRVFAIDRALNGADLLVGEATIHEGPRASRRPIERAPRIGVDYAGAWAALPWRFFFADSPSVSAPAR